MSVPVSPEFAKPLAVIVAPGPMTEFVVTSSVISFTSPWSVVLSETLLRENRGAKFVDLTKTRVSVLQRVAFCVAACCSVLQRVLQRVAVCRSVLQCVTVCYSLLPCAAVCCRVLPCVAVCCSVLQYV